MGYYKRIRELREDHDLTQRQIAAILNITQTQYFRYEQGYRDIPTDLLIALAKQYGTTTAYILELTDNPERHKWSPAPSTCFPIRNRALMDTQDTVNSAKRKNELADPALPDSGLVVFLWLICEVELLL